MKKAIMVSKSNGKVILELNDIFKSFSVGGQDLEIIKGVNFQINKGDFAILFGPSGCGKSTVLNILLGLEPPTKGSVTFLGDNLYNHNVDGRSEIRKREIGMVYQQSNWIKALNVLENVYFPLTLRGVALEEREKRAHTMLELVGMEQGAHQIPTELSSGQQQRISLARALVSDPALIVADEPTGNLDSKAGTEIMGLFREFNQKGRTVIMVTHDLEYLSYANTAINMSDGQIIGKYSANDTKLKDLIVSKRGGVGRVDDGSSAKQIQAKLNTANTKKVKGKVNDKT